MYSWKYRNRFWADVHCVFKKMFSSLKDVWLKFENKINSSTSIALLWCTVQLRNPLSSGLSVFYLHLPLWFFLKDLKDWAIKCSGKLINSPRASRESFPLSRFGNGLWKILNKQKHDVVIINLLICSKACWHTAVKKKWKKNPKSRLQLSTVCQM